MKTTNQLTIFAVLCIALVTLVGTASAMPADSVNLASYQADGNFYGTPVNSISGDVAYSQVPNGNVTLTFNANNTGATDAKVTITALNKSDAGKALNQVTVTVPAKTVLTFALDVNQTQFAGYTVDNGNANDVKLTDVTQTFAKCPCKTFGALAATSDMSIIFENGEATSQLDSHGNSQPFDATPFDFLAWAV